MANVQRDPHRWYMMPENARQTCSTLTVTWCKVFLSRTAWGQLLVLGHTPAIDSKVIEQKTQGYTHVLWSLVTDHSIEGCGQESCFESWSI